MATTEAVRTFGDIYTDLLNRVRATTGYTPTENQAKRYANTGLIDMHLGTAEKLSWAERQSHLILQPSYSTGTVAITQGATAVTGAGSTLWNTANAWSINNTRPGGKMKVSGTQDTYTVSAVGSDTSITLAEKFVGSTVTAATYLYFEDEYTLAPDYGRPVDVRSFADGFDIGLIGRTEFRRRYPRNNVTGTVSVATIFDEDRFGAPVISINATDTSHDVDVAVGTCRDSTNTVDILTTALVKRLDATWSAGTGVGGLNATDYAAGTNDMEASTTYYFFVIMDATGTVDAGADKDINCTNLLADSGYTYYRRLATIVTNAAGNIFTLTLFGGSTPLRKIRFHHPPAAAQLIPYSYITRYLVINSNGIRTEQMVNDADEPIVPHRFRTAIVLRGLYWWYRDRLDDARSAEVLQEYNSWVARMAGDNEIGDVRPKFRPNMTPYKRRARRPWSGSGRRFDINGRFDRMEW
ncbi:MAG: hypothetical protein ACYTBJ_12535 [Planctomycetota bacterium]|jgi:hypothetical protein